MDYDYSRYRLRPLETLLLSGAGLILGIAINLLFFRQIAALILIPPCLFIVIRAGKKSKADKVLQSLHYHFKDAVSSIHTALRAGYSLENAIAEAYREVREMYSETDILVRELYAMCNRLKLKEPVEKLFYDLGERSGIEDIRMFAEVIIIAKRTGGNLDAILQTIWLTLCGKIDTKQEIDAAIAAKKFEQAIMSIMPAAIIAYMQMSFGDMIMVMYQSAFGHLVMGSCLAVYITAFVIGRRIVNVKL